jgi:hypothetical protein
MLYVIKTYARSSASAVFIREAASESVAEDISLP